MPQQKSPSQNQLFQTIYDLVKNEVKGKKRALRKFIDENEVSINVFNSEGYAVIALLAKENDVERVRFLIDEFDARRNQAIFGAAWGGHEKLVSQLIAEGANPDWAAAGAGFAGNGEYLQELVSQEGAEINWGLCGAVQGKKIELARELLLLPNADPNFALSGAGMSGDIEFIKKLVEAGRKPDAALSSAVAVGNEKLAAQLIQLGAEPRILFGAARGGQLERVNKLINRATDKQQKNGQKILALMGAIHGGQVEIFRKFLDKDYTKALVAASITGDFKLMNKCIENGADWTVAIEGMQAVNAINGHEKRTIHQLAFIDSFALRTEIAKIAHSHNSSLDVWTLLKKGSILNQLIKWDELNFQDAEAKLNETENELKQIAEDTKEKQHPYTQVKTEFLYYKAYRFLGTITSPLRNQPGKIIGTIQRIRNGRH